MDNAHAHSALIDQLGKEAVKNTYGIERAVLSAWRKRGIPHRFRPSFAKLCAMNGVLVPQDFYAEPKPLANPHKVSA